MWDRLGEILIGSFQALLGVILGAAIIFCAVLMAGAGHGWGSAGCSAPSIIGAPLALIALANRQSKWGWWLAIVVCVGAVALDIFVLLATWDEGFYYVAKVWHVMPEIVVVWGVMFLSWQVMAALVVMPRRA